MNTYKYLPWWTHLRILTRFTSDSPRISSFMMVVMMMPRFNNHSWRNMTKSPWIRSGWTVNLKKNNEISQKVFKQIYKYLKLSEERDELRLVFCCFCWISAIWLVYSEAVISWPLWWPPASNNALPSLTPKNKCFNLFKGHFVANKLGFLTALQLHTVPREWDPWLPVPEFSELVLAGVCL